MRVAWFHPAGPSTAAQRADLDAVAVELTGAHVVDHVDESRAHDFVWRHFRQPYDLTILELADTHAHQFIWPYLFHFPGVLVLRAASLRHSRAAALIREDRLDDLQVERAFGGWHMLRAPVLASRLVVVHDESFAQQLRMEFPDVEVRVIPIGVPGVQELPDVPQGDVQRDQGGHGALRVAVAGARVETAERAAARARTGGANVCVTRGDETRGADVVVALEWPPRGAPPIAALHAMSAGTPVIVFETEATAAWPAWDPQTWQPRGYGADATAIAITIDPRDEEHSLMLAMRRLAADAELRASLGAAARTWARGHATVADAAVAWERVLMDAVRRVPPARPADWPAHLAADGSAPARAILRDMSVTVDFLEP